MLLLLTTLAQAQNAQIQVQVPSGTPGTILVDGQDTGVQAPGTVSVTPGDHTIQVSGDCVSASQSVSVTAGQELSLSLTPTPIGGLALVNLSPANATLTVDGAELTISGGLPLTCGAHTLTASAPGMSPQTQELTVEMGGAYRVTFALVPLGAGTAESGTAENGTAENGTTENGTAENGTAENGTAEPPETSAPVDSTAPPPKERNTSLLAGGALTAVGAGVMLAGGVVRLGVLDDYQELSTLDANGDGIIRTPEDTARATELWDNSVGPARSRSMALFVVGGALMATGTGVILLVDEQGQPILGYSGTF